MRLRAKSALRPSRGCELDLSSIVPILWHADADRRAHTPGEPIRTREGGEVLPTRLCASAAGDLQLRALRVELGCVCLVDGEELVLRGGCGVSMALLSRDGTMGKATYANHVIARRQSRRNSRRPLEGVDHNAVAPLACADLNHESLISPYPFSPSTPPPPTHRPRQQPRLIDLEPLQARAVHARAVAPAVRHVHHHRALAVRPLLPLGRDLGAGGDVRGELAPAGGAVVVAVDGLGDEGG